MKIKLQVTLNHTLKISTRVLVHKTKLSLHYIPTVMKTSLYSCIVAHMQYDLKVNTKSGRYKKVKQSRYRPRVAQRVPGS